MGNLFGWFAMPPKGNVPGRTKKVLRRSDACEISANCIGPRFGKATVRPAHRQRAQLPLEADQSGPAGHSGACHFHRSSRPRQLWAQALSARRDCGSNLTSAPEPARTCLSAATAACPASRRPPSRNPPSARRFRVSDEAPLFL